MNIQTHTYLTTFEPFFFLRGVTTIHILTHIMEDPKYPIPFPIQRMAIPREGHLDDDFLFVVAKDESLNLKPNQIPRFPSNLDRIGKERGYIAPTTVAIGPY